MTFALSGEEMRKNGTGECKLYYEFLFKRSVIVGSV